MGVKTFLLLIVLCMLSNSSFAKWSFITTNSTGDRYYVDFSRVTKEGDEVYFWTLSNYTVPVFRSFSATSYILGDCTNFRYQSLKHTFYKNVGAQGNSREVSPEMLQRWGWRYPNVEGSDNLLLQSVCAGEMFSIEEFYRH